MRKIDLRKKTKSEIAKLKNDFFFVICDDMSI